MEEQRVLLVRCLEVPALMLGEALRLGMDAELVVPGDDHVLRSIAPGGGLFQKAGVQQCVERQRSIPQPAEPVIPIARAAELLWQRSGRCGDNTAGFAMGECLQGNQRAQHRLRPLATALGLVRLRPLTPPCARFFYCAGRIGGLRNASERG